MFHRFHTGTWQRCPSGRVPTRFIPVRVARATVTMAVLRICALLLLFDCQEAFHCCLVVACINRINMISIECHRSGERCPGKREFDNRMEINRVRSGEIMWLFPLTLHIVHGVYNLCLTPVIERRLTFSPPPPRLPRAPRGHHFNQGSARRSCQGYVGGPKVKAVLDQR